MDSFLWIDAILPLLVPSVFFLFLGGGFYLAWKKFAFKRRGYRLMLVGASIASWLIGLVFFLLLLADMWLIAGWLD